MRGVQGTLLHHVRVSKGDTGVTQACPSSPPTPASPTPEPKPDRAAAPERCVTEHPVTGSAATPNERRTEEAGVSEREKRCLCEERMFGFPSGREKDEASA